MTRTFIETVYFIAAYGKKDKANLTKKERNNIKKLIDDIERSLEGEKYEKE